MNKAALRELCTLTTRDESGRHFTEVSDHWEELEQAGLISVHRPVHAATGLSYDQTEWTLEVTEQGQDAVDAFVAENPELFPEE